MKGTYFEQWKRVAYGSPMLLADTEQREMCKISKLLQVVLSTDVKACLLRQLL